MPTLHDVQEKGSKVLKLPPVCNCFTLAMTNKLVVIINSLKVPKIKKLLLYEMKLLLLQLPPEPLTRGSGGYCPLIPVLCPLSPTKFIEPPPKQNSRYATGYMIMEQLHVAENSNIEGKLCGNAAVWVAVQQPYSFLFLFPVSISKC